MKEKIKNYSLGIARAYPVIIQMIALFFSILGESNEGYILFVFLILNEYLNRFLKNYIFKPLFKNKTMGLFGRGLRPEGATDSQCFLYDKRVISKSYGMPSGHSQSAGFFSSYIILKTLNSEKNMIEKGFISALMFSLMIFVMYSRVLFNCHTVQQTIVGALIGISIGVCIYNYMDFFSNMININ